MATAECVLSKAGEFCGTLTFTLAASGLTAEFSITEATRKPSTAVL